MVFDSVTALLQLFLIILTYETGHYGNEADLDDGYNADGTDEEAELLSGRDSPQSDKLDEVDSREKAVSTRLRRSLLITPHGLPWSIPLSSCVEPERPILDFRFRQTLHRVMNDKPLTIVNQNEPAENGSTSGSEDAQARRQRLQQARTRSRRRRLGQSDEDIEQGRDSATLDARSDEEREVGLPTSSTTSTHTR